MKSSKNFKMFDYSRYLKQQKIYGILELEELQFIGKEKDFFYYIENLKGELKQNLFLIFDNEKAGFLSGLLLGEKRDVLEETKISFRDSNLSHILAISGMHVTYVSFGVKFLLDRITYNQRLKNGLMIAFLIFFAVFTGGSPSCLRACIMCSMIFLSKTVYRKNDFYISMLISLDIIFILNPYNIESVGLWLSYLSTFGMVYINQIKWLENKNKIFQNICSSLSCNLMIFPVICNCYHKISLTFLISNLLISFAISPIMIFGYIHLFLGKFSIIFSFIEMVLLDFILGVGKFFGNLQLSKIIFPSIPIYFWIIYYLIILSSIYFYKHKELFEQLKMYLKYIVIIFIGIMIIFCVPKKSYFEIHFLDVGQGDCTLIITPSRKTILIDGGNNEGYDNGENVVAPYLLNNGISKINYLVVSHRRFRPYWRTVLYFRKY